MPNRVVTGIVLAPGRRPAAGARVTMLPRWTAGRTRHALDTVQDAGGAWRWALDAIAHRPTESASALTNDAGCYELVVPTEIASDGDLTIWAELGDLVSPKTHFCRGLEDARQQLQLGPTDTPRLTLVDENGAPVRDADTELRLFPDENFSVAWILHATSNAEGILQYPRVPRRTEWWALVVDVEATGLPPLSSVHVNAREVLGRGARLVVPRGVRVHGRISRAAENGHRQLVAWSFPKYGGFAHSPPNHRNAVFVTHDEFTLVGVPRGYLTIMIEELPDAGPPEVVSLLRSSLPRRTLRLRRLIGKKKELGTIALLQPHSVSGRVQMPDGTPATSGWVTSEPDGPACQIRPDGTFLLNGLHDAPHQLGIGTWLGSTLYLQGMVNGVAAGATNVVVRVGGGTLIVRFHPVERPDERLEVEQPTLHWGNGGCIGSTGRASQLAAFCGAGIQDGLRVEAPGYKTMSLPPALIRPDEPAIVDVELEPLA